MSGKIFISYRREESRSSARSLYELLSARFDRKQVLMDIDVIALDADYVKAIEKTVGECDVLVAVIGKDWATSCDQEGQRRFDNPEDFVRIEIGTALRRDIRMIPVLVDGALMPRHTDLPDDLKQLVRRNALRVGGTHFDHDCRRLVAAIEHVLEKVAAKRHEREEKERLEQEPQSQPPSPVAPDAPSTSPAKPEADKPIAEIPEVVYPLELKTAESERDKPPPSSSAGTGGKRPSKQVIVFLAIAAVLVIGGLVYLTFRLHQSPLPQPAPNSHEQPLPISPGPSPPVKKAPRTAATLRISFLVSAADEAADKKIASLRSDFEPAGFDWQPPKTDVKNSPDVTEIRVSGSSDRPLAEYVQEELKQKYNINSTIQISRDVGSGYVQVSLAKGALK